LWEVIFLLNRKKKIKEGEEKLQEQKKISFQFKIKQIMGDEFLL